MPVATKAHFKTEGGGRQRGAALVVALLLLLVITLLAVAGMNAAAVELVMAGNEVHNNVAVATSATDTYNTILHSDLGGAAQPAVWGNSWNSFSTYDFTITSQGSFLGNSVRGAQSTHAQGIAVLAPASAQTSPPPGAPTVFN